MENSITLYTWKFSLMLETRYWFSTPHSHFIYYPYCLLQKYGIMNSVFRYETQNMYKTHTEPRDIPFAKGFPPLHVLGRELCHTFITTVCESLRLFCLYCPSSLSPEHVVPFWESVAPTNTGKPCLSSWRVRGGRVLIKAGGFSVHCVLFKRSCHCAFSWGPEDFQQNSFLTGCLPGSALCSCIGELRIKLISKEKKNCDLVWDKDWLLRKHFTWSNMRTVRLLDRCDVLHVLP